jgi:hypothetical protein
MVCSIRSQKPLAGLQSDLTKMSTTKGVNTTKGAGRFYFQGVCVSALTMTASAGKI